MRGGCLSKLSWRQRGGRRRGSPRIRNQLKQVSLSGSGEAHFLCHRIFVTSSAYRAAVTWGTVLVVCLAIPQALKLKAAVAVWRRQAFNQGAVAHVIGGGSRSAQAASSHKNTFFREVAAPYDAGIKERWTCFSSRDKISLMLRCLTFSLWGHMLSVVCGIARVLTTGSTLVPCGYRVPARSKKTAPVQSARMQQYCGSVVAYVTFGACVSYMVAACAHALRCVRAGVALLYCKYQKRFVACNHEPLIFLVGHQGLEPRTN